MAKSQMGILKTCTLFFNIRSPVATAITSLDFHQCIPGWCCCVCPELLPSCQGRVVRCLFHHSIHHSIFKSLWKFGGPWSGRRAGGMRGSFPLALKGSVHTASTSQHSSSVSVGTGGGQRVSSIPPDQAVGRDGRGGVPQEEGASACSPGG